MIDRRLKAAVIGVGYLGRFHAQKYKAIPEAELAAVCDLNPETEKFAQELDTRWVKDYRQLKGHVDAVTVASSTPSHFEIAKFFLENGVHVHVEKPMTEETSQGRELVKIAKERNLKLQVGHVERFNPALVSAREKLKNPFFIECHRLAPFKPRSVDVDVVLDLMIHDIDVILSLVNSPVVGVSAVGTPVLTRKADIANARLEFESGAIANVTASRVSQSSTRKFRVFQPSQYLSIDFGTGEVNLTTKVGDWKIEKDGEIPEELPLEFESWSLDKKDALLEETRSFVHAILHDQPVQVSGEDGLRALEVADRILKEIERRLNTH